MLSEMRPKKKSKVVKRSKKIARFRPGHRVVLKSDPNGDFGIVVAGNPLTMGDIHAPRGIFPYKVEGMILVRWKIKGKNFDCIEKISDVEVKSARI